MTDLRPFAPLDRRTEDTRPTLPPGRVWLALGEIACAGCGRAVPAGRDGAMSAADVILDAGHVHARPVRVPLGKCSGCAGLDVAARRMAGTDDPSVARLLAPYRVLRLPLPDPGRVSVVELRRWLGRFTGLDWASRVLNGDERPQACAVEPWGHVGPGVRADLVETMARWQHTRAFPGRPVRIRPPAGAACLACGVDGADVEPGRAHIVSPGMLWRRLSVDGAVIGGKGGRRLTGALCPDCVAAATDEHGRLVMGPSSLERALADYWDTHGEPDAARWLRNGEIGGVVGWAATGREPNREPWAHMEIPELDAGAGVTAG